MNGGKVIYHFEADDSKLNSTLSKVSSGVSSAFKVATGAIIGAGAAVGVLVKKSVEGYADFEQLEGGLISLFGEGSNEMNKIMESSEQAWKNLTMSQNDYLTSFESAYPLVNAGLSENADSIEYTNKMLQISSDLYNTYGGSVEQYQNAINWALKGTYSYLDNLNLGIKGTQEGFIEAANASGVLGREIKDVSELTSDEIIDVIQHYSEAYGVWGKTAEEAGTTIIGSLNMTKSAWSNFMTGLSKGDADINSLIDNLVSSATTFASNVIPVIMKALEGIGQAIPQIAQVIGEKLPDLFNAVLPGLIDGITSLLDSLIQALPGLINTLVPVLVKSVISLVKSIAKALPGLLKTILDAVITIANSLAQELPTLIPEIVQSLIDALVTYLENIDQMVDAGINLIMSLIDGIMNAIPILIEKLPTILEALITGIMTALPKLITLGPQIIISLITGIIGAIPTLIENMPEIISGIIEGLKQGFSNIIQIGKELLSKLWEGIQNHFPNLAQKIKEIPPKIIEWIKNGLSGIFNVGVNLVKGLWNGIKNVKDWIVDKIKGFGSSVLKAIKGIFGIHSPSTEFEWVGKMNMLGLEQGMEGMKSQLQGTIDSMFNLQPNVSGSMSSAYSPQMNIVVNNNMELDPLGQVVNNVKTFSGGAKNDYNWGSGL